MCITNLKYSDLQQNPSKIQKGDLIFTRLDRGFQRHDTFIFLLQKINRLFTGKLAPLDNSRFVHVALVTKVEGGKVEIAEAMPAKGAQLRRINFLKHNSYTLYKNDKYHYEVYRPTANFENVALKSAEIAEKITQPCGDLKTDEHEKEKDMMNTFSFRIALKGMIKKDFRLSKGGKKRAFKAIYDERKDKGYAIGGSKVRQFFCSSFVGYLFQRVVSVDIYPDLEVPQNLSQKKRHKDVSKWSKEMARDQEAGDRIAAGLEEKKVNFNYKYLIPSQLKSHIEDQGLFEKVCAIYG